MSWNELLNNISEELNENSPIIKRKSREKVLFEKIAHEIIEDEINELDIKAVAQDVKQKAGEVKQKVQTGIKAGWQGLKNKIKEVATVGFRLGAAVGKLFNGKYVLFSKSGKILTPPADDVKIKKIASGKKPVALTYKSKAGPMDCSIGDKLDKGFGTQITKSGAGVFYVIDPKSPGVTEGIDYNLKDAIFEAEEDDLKAMAEIDNLTFSAFTGEGGDALKSSFKSPKVAPVEVNYDDFNAELGSLLQQVKEGSVGKETGIKTLGIYAPTGWGKSQIIEKLAAKHDYFYWPLELQKVDINVIQGFPYLDDIESADAETKQDRLERAKKVVKMAPSEFLPPSKHSGNFLLFFDEFNRADSEKMSAVMNLLLTGELGGAASLVKSDSGKEKLDRYQLPKKIVVVLAMNTGTQVGISDSMNGVKDLDIATLERVHRVVHGKYHLPSWSKNFANIPYVWEPEAGDKKLPLHTRVPGIIMNFLAGEAKEKDGSDYEKPFLLPIEVAGGEPGSGGGQRTASPRSWTMFADAMYKDGYSQWNSLSDDSKNKYLNDAKSIMDDIKKKVDGAPEDSELSKIETSDDPKDYLFAAWVRAAPNQIRLASKQAPELGDKGVEHVGKMVRSFIKKGKSGISDEDILFNYKSVRPLLKANIKNLGFGTEAQMLARLFSTLSNFKNEKEIEDYMESKSIPIISKQGIVEQIYQTFKAMHKDLDFNPDDFASFTHLVEQAAKSGENGLLRKLHQKMAGKWDVYIDNLKKKIQTKSQVEKELEKIGGEDSSKEDKSNEELNSFIKGLKL